VRSADDPIYLLVFGRTVRLAVESVRRRPVDVVGVAEAGQRLTRAIATENPFTNPLPVHHDSEVSG
jgi:hypothetical protein